MVGGAVTLMFLVPVFPQAPTVTLSVTAAPAPAVQVMAGVLAPLVIVPPVMVQTYGPPDMVSTGTEAVFPVEPAQTGGGEEEEVPFTVIVVSMSSLRMVIVAVLA